MTKYGSISLEQAGGYVGGWGAQQTRLGYGVPELPSDYSYEVYSSSVSSWLQRPFVARLFLWFVPVTPICSRHGIEVGTLTTTW
jgi:hypothetical protein